MIWYPRIFTSLSKKSLAVDHCFVLKTLKSLIKIVSTSSLSGEGSLLKAVYFSFGSPLSAYDVSNPIFEIKATEDKTKISVYMFSGSGKNILLFGSLAASASSQSRYGGLGEWLVIPPHNISARQAKRLMDIQWEIFLKAYSLKMERHQQNDIFEGGFHFEASESRKKFDSTASSDQGAIGDRSIERFLEIHDK